MSKKTKPHLFFNILFLCVYSSLHSICLNPVHSHALNALDSTSSFIPCLPFLYSFLIFFEAWEQNSCVTCLSLSVWQMKITQSKTVAVTTITGHLETVLSAFQSLSLSLALFFHSGHVSKPTVGLHHKQIMSNCKCVCFLKGGGARVNGVFLPPSSGFAVPARHPTELGLILAVAALSEIKMGTPPVAFPPSQEYLYG